LEFDPQAGHEQAGRRPALVLSPASYNILFGLALVCPITNQREGNLWEWPIPDGVGISAVILTDQVRNLDWRARRARLAAQISGEEVARILEATRRLLE
jgi:mRNA interferase MazF